MDEESEIRFLSKGQMCKCKNEEAKNFAFLVESYLVYNNDDDKFTKKEILEFMKEILVEEYKINSVKK